MRELPPIELARIADYLAQETPVGERAAVEQWIDSDPLRRAFVDDMMLARRHDVAPGRAPSILEGVSLAPHVAMIANALDNRIVDERRKEIEPGRVIPRHVPRGMPTRRRSTVAIGLVSALAIAVMATGLWTYSHTSPSISVQSARSVVMQEYVTPKGQRGSVTLTDGTVILLNVDSRLRIPKTYGDKHRDVYLEGEAQFSVTHHSAQPFTVHAAGTTIRELGTVFGVRAYSNEGRTQVVVAEGRISVIPTAAAIPSATVLNRSEMATVTYDGTTYVNRNIAINEYLDWTSGRMVFRDATIAEVLVQLNRWYDLDFQLTDPALSTRRVNLFVPDQTWRPGMLEMLERTLNVQIRRDGRIITLSPVSTSK